MRLDLDPPRVEPDERMRGRPCEHASTLGAERLRLGHGFHKPATADDAFGPIAEARA
jgi:hypothetical protein